MDAMVMRWAVMTQLTSDAVSAQHRLENWLARPSTPSETKCRTDKDGIEFPAMTALANRLTSPFWSHKTDQATQKQRLEVFSRAVYPIWAAALKRRQMTESDLIDPRNVSVLHAIDRAVIKSGQKVDRSDPESSGRSMKYAKRTEEAFT